MSHRLISISNSSALGRRRPGQVRKRAPLLVALRLCISFRGRRHVLVFCSTQCKVKVIGRHKGSGGCYGTGALSYDSAEHASNRGPVGSISSIIHVSDFNRESRKHAFYFPRNPAGWDMAVSRDLP
jgi:hypothetical protein